MRRNPVFSPAMLALIGVLLLCSISGYAEQEVALIKGEQYQTFIRLSKSPLKRMPDLKAWKRAVPQVTAVTIRSTYDNTSQRALFYNSGSGRKKPLLLVLHSWSEDYRQMYGIPYGIWAVKNDWVLMHPDFRGTFAKPKATGSEAAVRDILDAVDYAKEYARIDESRIYVTGFSGGAMATLIMVGRYPEIWAGAVAWVPVYDLVEWYKTTRHATHDYSRQIASSCGGLPLPGTGAAEECRKRSPASYLKNAKGRGVKVYIATGIDDRFVPPSHTLNAFNDLAGEADRISAADIRHISSKRSLPRHLAGTFRRTLRGCRDQTCI